MRRGAARGAPGPRRPTSVARRDPARRCSRRSGAGASTSARRAHVPVREPATVRYQVQEMIRAERMTREEDIRHELETYNELLGGRGELGVLPAHRDHGPGGARPRSCASGSRCRAPVPEARGRREGPRPLRPATGRRRPALVGAVPQVRRRGRAPVAAGIRPARLAGRGAARRRAARGASRRPGGRRRLTRRPVGGDVRSAARPGLTLRGGERTLARRRPRMRRHPTLPVPSPSPSRVPRRPSWQEWVVALVAVAISVRGLAALTHTRLSGGPGASARRDAGAGRGTARRPRSRR